MLTMHPKDRGPNEGVTFEVDNSFQFNLTVGNKKMMMQSWIWKACFKWHRKCVRLPIEYNIEYIHST